MKTLLLILIFYPLLSFSQNNPESENKIPGNPKTAGQELEIAADHFEIGSVAIIGGAVAVAFSLNKTPNLTSDEQNISDKTKNIIGIAGGILSIAGFILQIESFSHIRNAGLLIGQNSVGIAIKL